jgi:hypothetical protein
MSGRFHTPSEKVELGLLNIAWSDFRKTAEARNAEQTGNHGITSKFRASDVAVVQDTHIHREAIVAVGEFN